jgi:hypothetical protein
MGFWSRWSEALIGVGGRVVGWFIAGLIVGVALCRWIISGEKAALPSRRSFRAKGTNEISELECVAIDPMRSGAKLYVIAKWEGFSQPRASHEAWPEVRFRESYEEVFLRDGKWQA